MHGRLSMIRRLLQAGLVGTGAVLIAWITGQADLPRRALAGVIALLVAGLATNLTSLTGRPLWPRTWLCGVALCTGLICMSAVATIAWIAWRELLPAAKDDPVLRASLRSSLRGALSIIVGLGYVIVSLLVSPRQAAQQASNRRAEPTG
jgi:hypothetical protein